MKKTYGYVIVFLLGGLLCFGLMRLADQMRVASPDQAKRNVVSLLDRPPAPVTFSNDMFINAAAKIEPAVVNIDTVMGNGEVRRNALGVPLERNYVQGKGSGVLISPDGYLVTNNHVIEDATSIRVTLRDGRKLEARVIGTAPESDLAVLKVDASGLPAAQIGDSNKLRVGEFVVTVGYPLGIGTTVTHGIVSAVDRQNLPVGDGRVLKKAVQTDAPINHGNSGGALANLSGQLVGINTAIASDSGGGSIGIGFAIPSNVVREIALSLVREGKPVPTVRATPFMGIEFLPSPPEVNAQLSLKQGLGVIILSVRPLSPAADAGIQLYDVIVEIDGKPVTSQQVVRQCVDAHTVGDSIPLVVVREDGRHSLNLTLGRRPDSLSSRR